jgi:hypothetical protein
MYNTDDEKRKAEGKFYIQNTTKRYVIIFNKYIHKEKKHDNGFDLNRYRMRKKLLYTV